MYIFKNPNVKDFSLKITDQEWKELPEWKQIFYNHYPDPVEKEKIDLDAIIEEIPESWWEEQVVDDTVKVISLTGAKQLAREAVRQVLVLAAKYATTKLLPEEYRTVVDEQSILDVEKLII